jgi:hypothetical protein
MSGGKRERSRKDEDLEIRSLNDDDYNQPTNGKVFDRINNKNARIKTPIGREATPGIDPTQGDFDSQSSKKDLLAKKSAEQGNKVAPIPFYSQGQTHEITEGGIEKPMSSARALFGF